MAFTIYAFVLTNATLALAIGGPLNVLVLWAIRKHTPTELRPFAQLLAQTAVIDLLVPNSPTDRLTISVTRSLDGRVSSEKNLTHGRACNVYQIITFITSGNVYQL
jgi:hypothetical protein